MAFSERSVTDPVGTFVFADMAGFTALTEAHGDERAADLAGRLCADLEPVLPDYGARLVKALGDAVMLRVDEPGAAVRLGLYITGAVLGHDGWPAGRVGMHRGPAVERGGDFFGASVNLAARVVALARADEVLLTAATAAHAGRMRGVRLEPRGEHRLRNIRAPVGIVAALAARAGREDLLVLDPVCRMAVRPGPGAVARRWDSAEVWLCSPECAALFDAAPDHYMGG